MQFNEQNGIHYASKVAPFPGFEELYLQVRAKEQRLLDDALVAKLPFVTKDESIHYKEWRIRAHNFKRLKKYMSAVQRPATVMDLGSGNGWMAAGLAAANERLKVYAVDINEEELRQGARVFHYPNLLFCYGNIFEDVFPAASFDFIVLNGCAQYFEHLPALIERLLSFLRDGGELHIIDTPFYTDEDVAGARQRTKDYYQSLGFGEMAAFYHHHRLAELLLYGAKVVAEPLLQRIYSLMSKSRQQAFKWIRIQKA